MSSTGYPPPDHIRSPSPPASSYFPSFADSEFGEPQPTPGATSHFAYSTTLRRHTDPMGLAPQKLSDGSTEGLLQKALRVVTGTRSRDDEASYSLVNGRSSPPRTIREEKRETPSARFAHWSVEVCDFFSVPPSKGGFHPERRGSLSVLRNFQVEDQGGGKHSHLISIFGFIVSDPTFGRRIPSYISSRLSWLVYRQLLSHRCKMYTDTTSSLSRHPSRSSSSLRKRSTKVHLYCSFAEAR